MAAVRHIGFVVSMYKMTRDEYLVVLALCKIWLESAALFRRYASFSIAWAWLEICACLGVGLNVKIEITDFFSVIHCYSHNWHHVNRTAKNRFCGVSWDISKIGTKTIGYHATVSRWRTVVSRTWKYDDLRLKMSRGRSLSVTFSTEGRHNFHVPRMTVCHIFCRMTVSQSVNQGFFYSGLSNLNHCEVH